jgi:phosphate transport system ATP-binding protein
MEIKRNTRRGRAVSPMMIDDCSPQSSRDLYRIRVRELDFFYGPFKALSKVNFDIPPNQITALIGPSGCGKSTFLRTLNRMNDLIPKTRLEGEILLNELSIYDPDVNVPELRRRVGMVFQRPNPFPKSIAENVLFGPKVLGMQYDQDELIERCLGQAALWEETKDRLNRSSLALSLGQQQRLCIARVLAVEPEVILMDEPCSALDPISTERIEELMHDLKSKYTIVIVTHNMQQAARVSDLAGFFLMGELIEFDRTANIFTNAQDERTERYITGRFG